MMKPCKLYKIKDTHPQGKREEQEGKGGLMSKKGSAAKSANACTLGSQKKATDIHHQRPHSFMKIAGS